MAEIKVTLPMKKEMHPTKIPADMHNKENGIKYSCFLQVVKKLAKGGNINPIKIPVIIDKNKLINENKILARYLKLIKLNEI